MAEIINTEEIARKYVMGAETIHPAGEQAGSAGNKGRHLLQLPGKNRGVEHRTAQWVKATNGQRRRTF